jgi:hypothetical protein
VKLRPPRAGVRVGFQFGHAVAGGLVGGGEVFDFGFERAGFVAQFEHRGGAFLGGAAAQHALAAEHHAGEGDEGHAGVVRAQAQRGGEVRHDEHLLKQALDHSGNPFVRLDAVERPGGGTFGQRFHLGAGRVGDEGFRQDGGDAEFLLGEAADDRLGGGLVLDEHGVEVSAERGFDGAGAAVVRLDEARRARRGWWA